MCAIRNAALARRTAYRLPYVKYSTGANRTTRTAYRALGKPNQTAARRAFLAGSAIGEWYAEAKCFFRRDSAISRPQRLFFAYFFLTSQKKVCPRSESCSVPTQNKNGDSSFGLPPFCSQPQPRQELIPCRAGGFLRRAGPQAQDGGGTVVATGTPEQICQVPDFYTGQFLKPVLERTKAIMAGKKGV